MDSTNARVRPPGMLCIVARSDPGPTACPKPRSAVKMSVLTHEEAEASVARAFAVDPALQVPEAAEEPQIVILRCLVPRSLCERVVAAKPAQIRYSTQRDSDSRSVNPCVYVLIPRPTRYPACSQ